MGKEVDMPCHTSIFYAFSLQIIIIDMFQDYHSLFLSYHKLISRKKPQHDNGRCIQYMYIKKVT